LKLKWHAARWCPGVLRLVLDGAKPARVPQTVIEGLKARERNGVIILPPHHRRAAADFAVGDRLRVTSGPFTGLIGLYQGQRGADRVAMLLRWLGADRPAVLPRSDVARMMR
jgi:transcriptional antiterminator RfaH